ncbi:MAG: hypothetical protein AAF909_14010, partial [Pseudomonadota bacterium]
LGPHRSLSLGARFAIGALVKTDDGFIREARAAALSPECAGGDDPLGARLAGLTQAAVADLADDALRSRLERDAADVRRALEERTQNLCRILAENMADLARDQVSAWLQFYENAALIRKVADMDVDQPEFYENLSDQYAAQQRQFELLAQDYLQQYRGAVKSMAAHGRDCFVGGFDQARATLKRRSASRRDVAGRNGAFSEGDAMEVAARHALAAWLDAGAEQSWGAEFSQVAADLAGEEPAPTRR